MSKNYVSVIKGWAIFRPYIDRMKAGDYKKLDINLLMVYLPIYSYLEHNGLRRYVLFRVVFESRQFTFCILGFEFVFFKRPTIFRFGVLGRDMLQYIGKDSAKAQGWRCV